MTAGLVIEVLAAFDGKALAILLALAGVALYVAVRTAGAPGIDQVLADHDAAEHSDPNPWESL